MNIIEVKNLTCEFSKRSFLGSQNECVLNGINLSVKTGKALALMGISGSGKSTLANTIMGLNRQTSGDVLFNGKILDLSTLKKRREFYKKAQIVFQDPLGSTNPAFSVFDVINEPLLHLSDLDKNGRLERVKKMCKNLQINENFLNKRAISLSGGELGRVCLARALAIEPKFLILDEALSSFDLVLQDKIIKFLNSLKGQISILFITHDLRLARAICDEIVLLQNGDLVEIINSNDEFKSELGLALESAVL